MYTDGDLIIIHLRLVLSVYIIISTKKLTDK